MNVHQNAAMNASSLHLLQASRCSITGGRALIVCLHWTGVTHTRKNLPHVGLFPEKQEKEAGLASKRVHLVQKTCQLHITQTYMISVEVPELRSRLSFPRRQKSISSWNQWDWHVLFCFFPEGKVSIEWAYIYILMARSHQISIKSDQSLCFPSPFDGILVGSEEVAYLESGIKSWSFSVNKLCLLTILKLINYASLAHLFLI